MGAKSGPRDYNHFNKESFERSFDQVFKGRKHQSGRRTVKVWDQHGKKIKETCDERRG